MVPLALAACVLAYAFLWSAPSKTAAKQVMAFDQASRGIGGYLTAGAKALKGRKLPKIPALSAPAKYRRI